MNPHPPLSSFPFVLVCVLAVSELALIIKKNNHTSAKVTLFTIIFLAVITPLTYYSGFWGLDYAEQSFQIPSHLIETHQSYARLFLILLIPLCLIYALRKSNFESKILTFLYRAFLLISLLHISYVSFLGGELVFSHGAGVKIENK